MESRSATELQNVIKDLELAASKRQLTMLVGAGISRSSGIPVSKEIISTLLEAIGVDQPDIIAILGSDLPFEAFMSYVQLNFPTQFGGFMRIFGLGKPNSNHQLISKLAIAGKLPAIYTTNFDELIEKSFKENAFNHFKIVDYADTSIFDASPPSIHKMHGTINTAQTTLAAIASGKWVSKISSPVKELFSGSHFNSILIMGYSFSDDFDINPIINEFVPPKWLNVYVINHANDSDFKVENLKSHKALSRFSGKIITCNTDMFVEQLSNKILGSQNANSSNQVSEWKALIQDWVNNLVTNEKRLGALMNCIAEVFTHLGDLNLREKYITRSIEVEPSQRKKAKWRINLAGTLIHQNRFDEARALYQKNIEETKGDTPDQRIALIGLGNIDLALYDTTLDPQLLTSAKEYWLQALAITDIRTASSDYFGIHLNLFRARRRLTEHAVLIQDTTRLVNQAANVGDLVIKATLLNNLGMLHADLGNMDQARTSFLASLELCQKIKYGDGAKKASNNLDDLAAGWKR